MITYTVAARNLGPRDAHGAVVSNTLSATVNDVVWSCIAAGDASCTTSGTVGGTGSLGIFYDTLSNFPAGGVVTYTLYGALDPSDSAVNVAQVLLPAGMVDADLANNSSTLFTVGRVFLPVLLKFP